MDALLAAPPVRTHDEYGGRIVLLLVALCLAIGGAGVTWKAWDMFGPAHRPMLQGWDDSFYYFWLPAVVIDHDLDFSKQLAHSGTVDPPARDAGLLQPRTATGLLPNKYPPGWALGSLPFFLAAHAMAPAGGTGFEPVYLLAVWLGQILYGAVGLWMAVSIVRRLIPEGAAAVAVLAVWLASPLVYYQTIRVSLVHSQLFALAMAIYWLALRVADGDDRRCIWWALGFCSAMLVATRNIDVVYLAFPAVALVRHLRSWRAAKWLALGVAGPAAVQLVAWKILFGSWLVYSYGDEKFCFTDMHLAEVLFSPRHGWFYWHPLLLVGMLAFFWWTLRRPVAWTMAGSLVVIIGLNAAWPCWWFASSFGNRGFEVATFFCMLGLAVLFSVTRHRPAWRRGLAAAVTLAVMWNLILLSLFVTRHIPRDEAVTYGDAKCALVAWISGRSAGQDARRP
jgi:hypothetical protein